ncbi:hypothetical protein [Roseibium sp.]|uniref:hypothetical protein n=1 Tax=Roseibium sp. TaxID=1936156 RepID=UPI003BAF80AF
MVAVLRKIHFFIIAASVGLFCLTVLLPPSNEQIALQQVSLLKKIFNAENLVERINQAALENADSNLDKYYRESELIGFMLSRVGELDDRPNIEDSEIFKSFAAELEYSVQVQFANGDFIGANRKTYDEIEVSLASVDRILDIFDPEKSSFQENVHVTFKKNLWVPLNSKILKSGCRDEGLTGPVFNMARLLEGVSPDEIENERNSLNGVKLLWDAAVSGGMVSFESLNAQDLELHVFARDGGIKVAEAKLSAQSGPAVLTNSEQENLPNLVFHLCVKEDGTAVFTNFISGLEQSIIAEVSPVDLKKVSLIPTLAGNASDAVDPKMFEEEFQTLNSYSQGFGEFSLDELVTIFSALSKRNSETLEFAGIKVTAPNVKLVGSVAVLFLLVYFYTHARQFVRTEKPDSDKDIIWIVLYKDLLSRFLSVSSLVLLPVVSIGCVAYRFGFDFYLANFEYSEANPQILSSVLELFVMLFVFVASLIIAILLLRLLPKVRSVYEVNR